MKAELIFPVWQVDFCKTAIFDANSDVIPPTSIISSNAQTDILLIGNELMVAIHNPVVHMPEN